jgi:hypothetical protein
MSDADLPLKQWIQRIPRQLRADGWRFVMIKHPRATSVSQLYQAILLHDRRDGSYGEHPVGIGSSGEDAVNDALTQLVGLDQASDESAPDILLTEPKMSRAASPASARPSEVRADLSARTSFCMPGAISSSGRDAAHAITRETDDQRRQQRLGRQAQHLPR